MNNIHIWKGSDPKRKFSSLICQAQKEGPQIIIYEEMEPVVYLAIEDYRKLNYQLMANDQEREKEALEWIEGVI